MIIIRTSRALPSRTLKLFAKQIIIIDFDDVLFDRKGAFAKASFKAGVDLSSGSKLYEKVKTDNNGIYNFKKHLKIIANHDPKKLRQINQSMEKVFKRAPKFLFPGVHKILQKLRQQANQLILASRGNVYFQKQKIYNSGITNYFDKIIISEKFKAKALSGRIKTWRAKNHEIIFIDDSKQEINLIKKTFAFVKIAHIRKGQIKNLLNLLEKNTAINNF